jgi:hypothetical protein
MDEGSSNEGNFVARVFDEGSANEGLRRENIQRIREVKKGLEKRRFLEQRMSKSFSS